mgnify:CR=1 FL=1
MEGIVMKNIQERAKEWSEHIVETTPYTEQTLRIVGIWKRRRNASRSLRIL